VDRHLPRPVQPPAARAPPRSRAAAAVPDPRFGRPAVGDQAPAEERSTSTTRSFPPRELCHFINAQKEQGIRAAQVEAYDDYTRRRVELYAEYEAQCQREGVVDFAELLLRCYELLSATSRCAALPGALPPHPGRRVPGHQPCCSTLAEAAGLGTAQGGACLFCVGDDDQSIYASAAPRSATCATSSASSAVANVIRLEQNYRSHGNILDAANALIKHNRGRLGKNLWTEPAPASRSASSRPFRLDEARWIVEEIRRWCAMGVARSADRAALPLQRAVARARAPAVLGRHALPRVWRPALLRAPGIKHALAYLRLIANPDDDTAFAARGQFPDPRHRRRSSRPAGRRAHAANSSLYNACRLCPARPAARSGFIA
jgi:DNA helicase-2/ATP-dependent DNA helicase PcrA